MPRQCLGSVLHDMAVVGVVGRSVGSVWNPGISGKLFGAPLAPLQATPAHVTQEGVECVHGITDASQMLHVHHEASREVPQVPHSIDQRKVYR